MPFLKQSNVNVITEPNLNRMDGYHWFDLKQLAKWICATVSF